MDAKEFLEMFGKICENHPDCEGCPIDGLCSNPEVMGNNAATLIDAVKSENPKVYWVSPKLFIAMQINVKRYEKTKHIDSNIYFAPMMSGGFAYTRDDFRCIPLEINAGVLSEVLGLLHCREETGIIGLKPAVRFLCRSDFVLSEFHKAVEKTIEKLAED